MIATKIAIRADASLAIGTGHIIRCLTLAEALRKQDAKIVFICREQNGDLSELIEQRGFRLHRLTALPGNQWQEDATETIHAIGQFRPDWLIVDHYKLDARWHRAVRPSASRIMVIDDLADRPHDCELLLDQNLVAKQNTRYAGKLPKHCVPLLGPRYALLQPAYAELQPRVTPRDGQPRRLLVSFGGVDETGLTLKATKAIIALKQTDIAADIVLSSASPQFEQVQRLVADYSQLHLHDRVPSLAPFMLAADLAIGAGGSTSWERLCLGLPSLIVSLAENQRPISRELARRKLAHWLGHKDAADEDTIRNALDKLIKAGVDPTWSRSCLKAVDGRGVERVCAVLTASADMQITVRHAALTDEELLLEWLNDATTRRNAFSPKPVTRSEHRAWFRSRLRNPENCVLFIAQTTTGVPMGQIRFDNRGVEWEISYAVAPAFRGRGIGRTMLAAGIAELQQHKEGVALVGQVKPDNAASRRIFEALDFTVRTSEPDRYVYERTY